MSSGVRGLLAGISSPAPSTPGQPRLGTQPAPGSRSVTPAQVPKARGEQSQQFFCLAFFLSCYVYFEFEI